MNFEGDNSMGTVIISTIIFIIVTLIVKSICRKHIDAKKTEVSVAAAQNATADAIKTNRNFDEFTI